MIEKCLAFRFLFVKFSNPNENKTKQKNSAQLFVDFSGVKVSLTMAHVKQEEFFEDGEAMFSSDQWFDRTGDV